MDRRHFVYFAAYSIDDNPDMLDFVKVGEIKNLADLDEELDRLGDAHKVFNLGVIASGLPDRISARDSFKAKMGYAQTRGGWYHASERLLKAIKDTAIPVNQMKQNPTGVIDVNDITEFNLTDDEAKLLIDMFDDNYHPPINLPRQIRERIDKMHDEEEECRERLKSLFGKIRDMSWLVHGHLVSRIYQYHKIDEREHVDVEHLLKKVRLIQ